jgi:hypothetical protein
MLLTVVLILFAMAALAALEITLFRRLGERDDRRRCDTRRYGTRDNASSQETPTHGHPLVQPRTTGACEV